MDEPPPFDLTLDQAAVVLAVAQGAMVRMWERDVPDMPFGASIPRAVWFRGEVVTV